MKLTVLSSSSMGNCYILHNENEALVIEAGVPFLEVKKALNFNVSKIAGALCTHSHFDHSKYVSEYHKNGIPVFSTIDVLSKNGIIHSENVLKSFMIHETGGFDVLPFPLKHDVECFGFLIRHKECGWIMFATDTSEIPFRFKDLNQVIIESNYCEEIVEQRMLNGQLNAAGQNRVENSHMSIQKTLQFFEENDMSKVQNIVLIHLSNGNSNAKDFKSKAEKATGKNVFIADKGLTIDFDLKPF